MNRITTALILWISIISCTSQKYVQDNIPVDYLESIYSEAEEAVWVKVLTVQQMQKIGQKAVGYSVNKVNCQVRGNLKGLLMEDTIVAYHNFIEGDRVFPAGGERVVFLKKSDSWDEKELWMAMENADFKYSVDLWKALEKIARKRKYQ